LVRLAGQFAGVLRVELPAESVKPLTGALRDLASEGLDVTVRPAGAAKLEAAAHVMMLAVVGYDYPGIVRNIAQVLADAGVNIEELDTHRSDAPMAGGSLFHAHALLRVPETVDVDRLRRDIETIAHDLMVDLEPEKETL
jgi:glycine cleavage system regulatory protein